MTSYVASRLHPGLSVGFSTLGFGAAQFGNLGRKVSDTDCARAVEAAWASGLRYFDTAPHYGLGLSERRLGEALRERPRSEFIVSTKVGRLLKPNSKPSGSDADNGFIVADDLTRVRDYTGDGVLQSVEESLERLNLETIDILWIHDPEEPTNCSEEALRGAVPALNRLRDEGLIKAWGVGSKDASVLREFAENAHPDLLMIAGRYTLLEQEQVGLMRTCTRLGIGVVAVGVFNSGLLAQRSPSDDAWYEYGPAPRPILDRARRLAEAAEDHGITLPGAALAFPYRHPAVVNVTVGMRNPEQIHRNVQLRATPIPEDFWLDLEARGLLKEETE